MDKAKDKRGLSFRDLKVLNETSLAKQMWRIMQNLESLDSLVLKSKYFKISNVMEAKTGIHSSFIWKSFIASIDLIKDGIY